MESRLIIPPNSFFPFNNTPESYKAISAQSQADPEQFWAQQAAELLSWDQPWKKILTADFHAATIKWFEGAKLNVSINCVDRHVAKNPEKIALIWEGNTPGEEARISYRTLLKEVEKTAAMLRKLGVAKGDKVAIYLPLIPEAVYSMLAVARIGAVHTVVFAGFSAPALRDRINDCGCKLLITANEALRGEKRIPLKQISDNAVVECPTIEHVLVVKRSEEKYAFNAGRDVNWGDLENQVDSKDGYPVMMDSEDPLFILYTSGSTGKPKGVLHTQAGYLLYAAYTHRLVFDLRENDIHFSTADIGWITGHSYVVYGPLANGVTSVLFEPTPVFPDPGRFWATVEKTKATIFYTAPTAIRTLLRESEDFVKKYDRSSIRILGTVGEPINPDAWHWYNTIVGEDRCPIVDTWWQTETGGILISSIPGATALKPGSAVQPLPGIAAAVVDDAGKIIEDVPSQGRLCITKPWPGMMRTVYGDHERFRKTYFNDIPGFYFSGDGARRDSEGEFWITGRVDDVLNVSGHRLGTAELEAAIVHSGVVSEAAVVGMPHDLKGQGIFAFCVLQAGIENSPETLTAIKKSVRELISPIATPDKILFIPGLPKTRSGKIMRRILRRIAEGEFSDFGDTSTLAEPGIVDRIVEQARG